MKGLEVQLMKRYRQAIRSYNFAPEIDGTVILSVRDKIDLKNYIGKFVEANISFADEYDLYGETIKILQFFGGRGESGRVARSRLVRAHASRLRPRPRLTPRPRHADARAHTAPEVCLQYILSC